MTQTLDLTGNTIIADGFDPLEITFDGDASDIGLDGAVAGVSANIQAALEALDGKDSTDLLVGAAVTGGTLTIAADDTIAEALQAIVDLVDPV